MPDQGRAGLVCTCHHRWNDHSAPWMSGEASVCMRDGCDCEDYEPSADCEDICMDECQGPCGVFS